MAAQERWRRSGGGAVRRVRRNGVARLHTPLYRLKTPSQQVALVLSALAEGLDVSAAERVFGFRHATITRWLVRAGTHAQTLQQRSFSQLEISHVQLDELRTRLRSHAQVLWLWVAIDPLTKCIPVIQLPSEDPPDGPPADPPLTRALGPRASANLHERWP